MVILNVADSQCVPYELAARMARHGAWEVSILAFGTRGAEFPAEEFGVPVEQLGASGPLPFGAVRRLWARIRRDRPDIVHVHVPLSSVWGTLLGRLGGATVVKTEHNDVRSYPRIKRLINAVMYSLTARLVCNSESTRRSLGVLERRTIGSRSSRIYNGVDFDAGDAWSVSRADARRELRLGDEFVLGSVARFVEQKNLIRLVRAFAQVKADSEKPLRLLLVGDGPLRGEIEETVAAFGLGSSVVLTGVADRRGVYRALGAMDAFVGPSLWEGFCNAAVEAAGSGLPVIASDIQTLREVLEEHALFCNPLSESAIADSIRQVLALPESERLELGTRAKAFVRRRYSLDRASERYAVEFDRILAQEHGG